MEDITMNAFECKVRPDDSIRNLRKADQAQLLAWLETMTYADVLLRAANFGPADSV